MAGAHPCCAVCTVHHHPQCAKSDTKKQKWNETEETSGKIVFAVMKFMSERDILWLGKCVAARLANKVERIQATHFSVCFVQRVKHTIHSFLHLFGGAQQLDLRPHRPAE